MVRNLRFSHLGLYVRDPEKLASFYRDVLGFVETDRGYLGDRHLIFLSRDPSEHHQIVLASGLSAPPPEAVVNQISFRLPSLEALQSLHRDLVARGVDDLQPINHGNAWSVYFRDPEGNRIEVTVDSDWYIAQPCREPVDLTRPADEVRAESEAWCRTQPGFRPIEEWRAEIANRIRIELGD
jgi:catechol-2,3-dioxygenase